MVVPGESIKAENFDEAITSIKQGVEKFLSTLNKAMTQGAEKLSEGEKLKLELSKRLFEEFAKVDSQIIGDNPSLDSSTSLAKAISKTGSEPCHMETGRGKEDGSCLGKRSFDQVSFSGDSMVEFDPEDDISTDLLNRSFEDVDFLEGRF